MANGKLEQLSLYSQPERKKPVFLNPFSSPEEEKILKRIDIKSAGILEADEHDLVLGMIMSEAGDYKAEHKEEESKREIGGFEITRVMISEMINAILKKRGIDIDQRDYFTSEEEFDALFKKIVNSFIDWRFSKTVYSYLNEEDSPLAEKQKAGNIETAREKAKKNSLREREERREKSRNYEN